MSPVGIFRTDAEGKCLAVNERWCEIAGLAPADARSEGWVRALHPNDRERVREEWIRATQAGVTFECKHRFQRPDGGISPVLSQALPEHDDRGGITGFIGTVTDLTRDMQLEAELALRNEQLQRLALQLVLAQEQERGRIASGLHDDVGQLLAIARAKLGMLLDSGARDAAPARVAELRGLVDRAIGETRALTFELSSPVLHELGLAAAVESLCEQLEKQSGVHFRVEAKQEPASLGADLGILLYQAVRQLCTNVVKHARATRAEVLLHADASRCRIVVADDGQGFDASEAAQHFGPDGGFGLFTIRETSSHMGGSFEIESSPGKGTRAVLSLPLG